MSNLLIPTSGSKAQDRAAAAKPIQSLPIASVFKEIHSSESGLTNHEAHERLRQFGPNEHAPPAPTRHLRNLIRQFTHFLDLARVGGKNASLGEMFNALKPKGVGVLDGFATTAAAYWRLLEERDLKTRLRSIFANLDVENSDQLASCGHAARAAVLETAIPEDIRQTIIESYDRLCQRVAGVIIFISCSSRANPRMTAIVSFRQRDVVYGSIFCRRDRAVAGASSKAMHGFMRRAQKRLAVRMQNLI